MNNVLQQENIIKFAVRNFIILLKIYAFIGFKLHLMIN